MSSAKLERSRCSALHARPDLAIRLDGVVVLLRGGQRLGASQSRLELRSIVRRDPGRQQDWIDAEPICQPGDGGLGRTRLAALDLADVLLREARAGQLRLRQARGHAERTEALAEASARSRRRERRGGLVHAHFSQSGSRSSRAPPCGGCADTAFESSKASPNHLTWLLDFRGRGSYSQAHTADDRTPDRMRGHHRRIQAGAG